MTIVNKVKSYLDQEHVVYQILEHSLAFTAMEIAGAQHVPGKQFIKAVIVKADDQYIMCVLSSTHRIDFDRLKKLTKSQDIFLAKESEIASLFPDYELGAEPPFGQLYGLKVYVDEEVPENDEIIFNAGTHTDAVKIKYRDFKRLVKPIVADFGVHL